MLFRGKLTVAAQPVGFTVTPFGELVFLLNAEAGQLPVADPIPITNGQPVAGCGQFAETVGSTIATLNVFVSGVPVAVGVTVMLTVRVRLVPVPVTEDVTEQV